MAKSLLKTSRQIVSGFAQQRQKILALVRQIPPGKVLTYGLVADYAGLPGRARLVGRALLGADEIGVPWWRVIRSDGSLAVPCQSLRLRQEIKLSRAERVNLASALWDASDFLLFDRE